MASWKESMINRLSNIINRNRSAAKISQVLCSSTHTTTMGPQNIPTVRRWLRKNTNNNFSSLNNLVGKIPGFGSLGFGK